ncbi:efflux RND transporter permease subunit [bacterium]|nr:efflux RND transporter permease subunit [bacterium]
MNHFMEFVLRSRLLFIILCAIVVGAGYYSYRGLQVDAFPDVTPSMVQVFAVTEGLAPEEVEKFVTYPIEVAMNGLPRLVEIRSVSIYGLSVVNIYFEDGMDIYFARQLVGERLGHAREQIPEGFGEPEMGPTTTGMGQILFYYLEDTTGSYSPQELREINDWIIKYNLQTVPGVTEVLSIGGDVRQYHILVKPGELLRYDLSLHDIIEAVEANNANIGAQFIVQNEEEFVVRSVGLADGNAALEQIAVKVEHGTPVYLSQVAEVVPGSEVRRGTATLNGETETVVGMVLKLIGTNSNEVIDDVKARLDEINEVLPEGVVVRPYYDQGTLVGEVVNTISSALLQGIALVALVLLIFMGGFRPSTVVALSIPFSIGFAFIVMKLTGMSANMMSLGGLAIAIGMMVDGTIVIVENVDRLLRESRPGESRFHTVVQAVGEVIQPIVFAISIIIIVFIPLFALQGVEGKTFRPLAYTVALAMGGSLMFAIILAPVFSYLLMRAPKKRAEQKPGAEPQELWIVRMLQLPYRPVVSLFVRQRWLAVLLAIVMLAIGAWTFPQLGSEFVPRLNEGDILVQATAAPSISLQTSSDAMLRFEKQLLQEFPEVSRVVTRTGSGEVGAHAHGVNSSEVFVELRPHEEWERQVSSEELIELMSHAFENFPGITFNFSQPIAVAVDELVTGTKAELAIKIFGEDTEELKKLANKVEQVIRTVPGAADVSSDQISGTPQLRIDINREAIARYGLSVSEVQEVIAAAVGGAGAGQIYEGIRRWDIVVRFAEQYRDTPEAIGRLLVHTPEGQLVPLSSLATIEKAIGARAITRENTQRLINVQCNVRGRDIGSFVHEAQAAIDAQVSFPPGYIVSWGGQFQLQQEANRRLLVVVPVTLALVFMLLFSSFNSLKNALLIILNIPLALVGGIVGLYISGENLSVPASVGFIALFGIALENGMVLVTYLNQLVRDGVPIDRASVEGALLRLRPVLMTALTTGLGLIPLLYATGTGSEVQRPLAVVVMGGLITSTVLTLLVLPALYRWLADAPRREQAPEVAKQGEGA